LAEGDNVILADDSFSFAAAPAVGPVERAWYRAPTMRRDDPPSGALAADALKHADALYRLARYLTGSNEDAEDLVQETFARALGASARFERGTNVRAWLFRILRNCHVDGYRRARTQRTHGGLDDEASSTASLAPREALRGDDELEHLRRVVGEDIEAALLSLTEDARTIVLLDLEGFSEAELAGVLDCAVGTVKSRLARARAALRHKLRDYRR
jgi:RNA polymerase sigma-70 factor, ECF subfamily